MALRGAGRAEAVRVLGVDILKDQPLREYRLLDTAAEGRGRRSMDVLNLLIEPDAAVVTDSFARRRGLSIGSRFDLALGDRVKRFAVRGILRNDGPAKVMDGNFVLLDIAAAQLAFDRLGRVDRIDVRLADPARSIAPRRPSARDCLPAWPFSARRAAARRSRRCWRRFSSTSGRCRWWRCWSGCSSSTTPLRRRSSRVGKRSACCARLARRARTVLALFLGEAAALAGNRLRGRYPAGLAACLGSGRPDLVDGHDVVCRRRGAGTRRWHGGRRWRPLRSVCRWRSRRRRRRRSKRRASARWTRCDRRRRSSPPVVRGAPACSSLPCVSWRPRRSPRCRPSTGFRSSASWRRSRSCSARRSWCRRCCFF